MRDNVLVDTNVWLDVINEDPVWYEWSANQLDAIAAHQRVALNVVVYAELSIRYARIEDFEDAIASFAIERLEIPFEAGFLAAKAYQRYRARGGAKVTTLPDFFIGAHAAVSRLTLLTRDAKRYREYFPSLKLIAPK
jgi:predicted nucleic acid-binding protein